MSQEALTDAGRRLQRWAEGDARPLDEYGPWSTVAEAIAAIENEARGATEAQVADEDSGTAFGAVVRQWRNSAGLTLRVLAERVQASFTYLSKIENGHLMPSRRLVGEIDRATHADGAIIEAFDRTRCPVCGRSARGEAPVTATEGPAETDASIAEDAARWRAAEAEGHVVDFSETGYGLQHPPSCRPDLIGCRFNVWLADYGEPPMSPGRYRMSWTWRNDEMPTFARLAGGPNE